MALTAVLLGVMIYSVTKGGYASESASFWSKLFEPLQKASTSISDKVTSSLDMLINAEKYYTENQQLKSEINELYNDIIDYDSLKRENEDLRAMLELSEEYESFTFSPPCSVIARTTNDPYASFTIDKGAEDGIKPQDPVVTSEGIVGVCYDVAKSTAKVRTLYSPKTAIGVYTLETKAQGIIEGTYELSTDGFCRMSYIDKTSEIKKGDVVVTSGSANYPAGQLVGIVEDIGMEDSGLSMYAVIKPAVDPETVSDVFVITGFEIDDSVLAAEEADISAENTTSEETVSETADDTAAEETEASSEETEEDLS